METAVKPSKRPVDYRYQVRPYTLSSPTETSIQVQCQILYIFHFCIFIKDRDHLSTHRYVLSPQDPPMLANLFFVCVSIV